MVSFYNISDNEYYVGPNKVSAIYLGNIQVYQDSEPFYTKALGSGIIRFTSQSGVTSTYLKAIRYKKNNESWTDWQSNDNTLRTFDVSVSSGDKVYWEGSGGTSPKLSRSTNQTTGNSFFSASCDFEVGGYLSSLLMTSDDFKVEPSMQTYQYAFLFRGATSLKNAEKLIPPSNVNANSSMRAMFSGCTGMTKAMKELPCPLISSGTYVYGYMFCNCQSLTDSPIIKASATTTNYSHTCMFSGCTSLTAITTYIQSSGGTNPFINWVAGVNSSGYFYKHPNSGVFTTGTTPGASTIPSNFQVEDIPNIT